MTTSKMRTRRRWRKDRVALHPHVWPVRIHCDPTDPTHCVHHGAEWRWSARLNRGGVICLDCRTNVGVQLGWVRRPWWRWNELADADVLERVA